LCARPCVFRRELRPPPQIEEWCFGCVMRSTRFVEMRCWAKMGVVVAQFMEVGRWCSASERGKQSPKKNWQRHINRRAAQISTGTVHKRIIIFMYILTGTLWLVWYSSRFISKICTYWQVFFTACIVYIKEPHKRVYVIYLIWTSGMRFGQVKRST